MSMRMSKKTRWAFLVPIGIAAILIFAGIGGGLVQYLWNWLLPPLFGWPPLTFWQALGLLALCRILFSGLGLGSQGSGRSRLRRRMAERWEQLTPEERERFRQGVSGTCGVGPSASESKG